MITGLVVWLCGRVHPALGFAVQAFWCWQALAMRGLRDESRNVQRALTGDTLDAARKAVGRIVGESAVLIFTAGMSTSMQNFFGNGGFVKSSGATLTVALYVYAKERYKYDNAFSVAVVLLVLTLLINLAAKAAGKRAKRKEER